ncbi:MAG: ribonuclease H-like domain-containing protein, partial [Acidobacteria bacterium]|nr:ribonuclease H-like domain-containing protein [Acidobacteriota bacterium]
MTAKNQIAWSRISALKPVRRAAETPVVDACPSLASADSGRLEHLLGAEVLKNNFGEFISSRQWFADAAPQEIPHSALRILAPKQIDQLELLADARNWLFLDTETTGLAGGTGTYAFLIGLAWWDANGLQVEQLFMRDYAEEHAVLLALTERLAERRVLVTFNGRSFDWPLLETRYRMTRKLSPPAHAAHLDLLHPARHVWRLRLGSVRLSELEKYVLGFERGPDLWSAMIPEIYFEYLRRGEVAAKPLVEVFRHNSMDLRGLAGLAVKFFELLKEPESAEADPLDLCGLSRLLRSRGPDYSTGARALYERSLAAGLPGALDRAARRELAVLAKRDKDY